MYEHTYLVTPISTHIPLPRPPNTPPVPEILISTQVIPFTCSSAHIFKARNIIQSSAAISVRCEKPFFLQQKGARQATHHSQHRGEGREGAKPIVMGLLDGADGGYEGEIRGEDVDTTIVECCVQMVINERSIFGLKNRLSRQQERM